MVLTGYKFRRVGRRSQNRRFNAHTAAGIPARRPLVFAIAGLAVLLLAGTPMTANAASEPIDPSMARGYVTDLGNRALSLLKEPSLGPAERSERFAGLMLQHIDFRQLGQRVLGQMYQKSSEGQRQEFYRLFAAFFIDTVNEMLGGLHVTGFALGKDRTFPDNEVLVATTIEQAETHKLDAGWRLALNSSSLKIVDVYVREVSATSHFNDKISRGTQTNISGVIAKLKAQLKGSPTLQVVATQL